MTMKKTVLSNMLWRLAERCGAQGVSFVVSLILARILLPEAYGVVSLITVFTSILNLFIDSGFKNALIQKKDADQLDFSTVFYFNIAMGVLLYGMMFAVSPFIAAFYDRPYMVPYIRVMSLTLVFGGINGVQQAIVARRMQFKRFFYATLTGTLFSAAVGIAMAYMQMGVWALIAQRLINQAIDTVFLWFTVRWRPSLRFSGKRLRPMFDYGSKLLLSAFANTIMENLTGLIVGKVYTAELLAYYDKGRNIPNLVVQNLQAAVQSVLFPVIAEKQDQREQVKKILRKSIMTSTYCIFPCMTGIAVCAEPLVRVLYTEKWIAMVPYLRLWCFCFAFYLWHTANLQVIQALGRSDIFLRIEVLKQFLSLAGILLAARFGVLAMLAAACIVAVLSLYINAAPNVRLAGYGFWEQLKDVLPVIGLNLLMGIAVYLIGAVPMPDIVRLAVQISTGVAVYAGGSCLLKLEIFRYLWKTVKELIH
ncbi:MAG TPA: lipopolysaccharide biosynthesis protein [Candidatus Eisenbergiella merdavium]|uniref:Lipopolysaccharide biosynthesis protein n=1 Tax=Candidatus Eisenbergiella merdavium TaxID=2838551 RepID=A0A9D2NIQ7_9FIRM|nr:lipopolysaccharide biosynthesis protein [Candidatus Eisenbergiella merdavium]